MAQITANGNYGPYKWLGNGGGTLVTSGTFDSATVKLQYSLDFGVTKVDYPNISQTVAGVTPFAILENCELYVDVAGGGGSLDIYMQVGAVDGAQDIGGASSILAQLTAMAAETITKDAGPSVVATVTNLKSVSLGSAQTLVSALGAGIKGQIRDLYAAVNADVSVSIYSTSGTMFVGELKAANGTVQLTPRQGFTSAAANEAMSIICTPATPAATIIATVNSVGVS